MNLVPQVEQTPATVLEALIGFSRCFSRGSGTLYNGPTPENTATGPLGVDLAPRDPLEAGARLFEAVQERRSLAPGAAHEDAPWTDVCSDLCTLSALRAQARNAAQHVSL